MSGDRYIIRDNEAIHFVTFTIVGWINIFTRQDYALEIVDALNYCVKEKGLIVYGWVVMSSHVHLLIAAKKGAELSDIIRDFKRHTSSSIVKLVQEIPESRREWLLARFKFESRDKHKFKLWQDGYHGIECDHTIIPAQQKLDYIHNNPVAQMIVAEPEHYVFSSASSYSGGVPLVEITFLD